MQAITEGMLATPTGGAVRLDWRPIATGDVTAWAELLAAAQAVDATDEHYDCDDLLEELADPALDPERDTLAAFADGRMVAYGLVRGASTPNGVHRVNADGCVHPDYRRAGLGREVLRRSTVLANELHRRLHPDLPAELHVYSYDGNAGATALLTASDLRPVRYWYYMQRDLAEPLAAVAMPAGLRLVGYDPAMDEALRLARNDAFADHWGSVDRDESSWRQWFTGSRAFRPALSFALLASPMVGVASSPSVEDIAGFLLSYEYEADSAVSGVRRTWVGQIGTRAPWRGRGVASALIATALAAYRDAGYQRAELSVDTDNPNGALRLYERHGFAITQRWTTFARPL